MKTLKASGALRHPPPLQAHFAHVTLLCYCQQDWADQSWAPPLKHILKVKKKKEKGENLLYF